MRGTVMVRIRKESAAPSTRDERRKERHVEAVIKEAETLSAAAQKAVAALVVMLTTEVRNHHA